METPKIIKVDGTLVEYPPANGKTYTLKELQDAVGGYFQMVKVPSQLDAVLCVNEEGIPRGLRLNIVASNCARMTIVGDALLCKSSQIE